MSSEGAPAQRHPAVLDAIATALVQGVEHPARLDWWNSDWNLGRELLGTARRPLTDEGRDEVLALTRGLVAAHRPDLVDVDVLLRLFGGALLRASAQGDQSGARSDELGRLLAARILLGVEPRSFYNALLSADGNETWGPLNESRNYIYNDLVEQGRPKAASQFRGPIDPTSLTTRRVLASYVEAGGEVTFDSYARPGRARIRDIAVTLLDRTAATLSDPESLAWLAAQTEARTDRMVTSPAQRSGDAVNAPGPADPMRTGTSGPKPRRRRTPRTRYMISFAVLLVVSSVLLTKLMTVSNDAGAPSGTATSSSRPIPTPPVGGGSVDLRGEITASNAVIGTTSVDGWIEAAADEQLDLTMKLTNDGDDTLADATLRTRLYDPPADPDTGLVVYLTVQPRDGIEVIVDGARLGVLGPPEDSCGVSTFTTSTLVFHDEEGATELRPTRLPEDVYAQEDAWLAEYALPAVAAGDTVELTGAIRASVNSGPPTIDGGQVVSVKLADDDDYTLSIGADVGDSVRLMLRLHNSSCNRDDAKPLVQFFVRQPEQGRRYINVFVRVRLSNGIPERQTFGPATININDRRGAVLQLKSGTTELWSGTCDRPVVTEQLDDMKLFGAGLRVAVPGYIPRGECETHIRFITTELLLVAR